MAINNLMQLSVLLRPGYYGPLPGMNYGLTVGEKEDMGFADCMRSVNLLETLKRLNIIWDVTYKGKRTKENDNELYYKITIWEKLNAESRK